MTLPAQAALRADGQKLLRALLEPCEGADEHSWRMCRRCTAMHGLENRFSVTMRALSALLDAETGTAEHEHRFHSFEVCTECGQTEAAVHGCHHCNEVTAGKRCWWCLRVAPPGTAPAQEPV